MKTIILILLLAALCAAQPSSFAALGLSYSPNASPAIAGTGLYAKRLTDIGTYSFTVTDALPTTLKPFKVTTQTATGIAQRVYTMGRVSLYIPAAAGISYSGTNTGWSWTTGGLAAIPVRGSWYVLPSVRVVKSSVSDGTGYQGIVGVLFGWGW